MNSLILPARRSDMCALSAKAAPQAKVKPTQQAIRIKGNMIIVPRTKLAAANVQLRVSGSMSLAYMNEPPKTTTGVTGP